MDFAVACRVVLRSKDAAAVRRALKAGACGYFARRDPLAAVLGAIVGAAHDERHVGPRIEHLLLECLAMGTVRLSRDEIGGLSHRERQVFHLVGAGHSGRAIAAELGVSVKTIETHRQRIKDKLRLKNGADLHRRAVLAVNGKTA